MGSVHVQACLAGLQEKVECRIAGDGRKRVLQHLIGKARGCPT